MNALKNWKILLSLTAIFTAGMVTGGSLCLVWVKKTVRERTSVDFYTEAAMNDLVKELQLTKEQALQIQPVVADTGTQMKSLYRDTLSSVWNILESSSKEIESHLDDQQKERFRSFLAKRRARFEKRMKVGNAG